MIFLLTLLASPLVSYSHDFKVGHDADLNQAFYVCSMSEPGDLMSRLIEIPDDEQRRDLATFEGCPFILRDREGPLFKIIAIDEQLCLDRDYDPISGTWYCEREGHQLRVSRGSVVYTVIFLSLDVIY